MSRRDPAVRARAGYPRERYPKRVIGAAVNAAARWVMKAGSGSVAAQVPAGACHSRISDVRNPGEPSKSRADLRRFSNEPVAEIVQCGEPRL
jgi:hypothetical protein